MQYEIVLDWKLEIGELFSNYIQLLFLLWCSNFTLKYIFVSLHLQINPKQCKKIVEDDENFQIMRAIFSGSTRVKQTLMKSSEHVAYIFCHLLYIVIVSSVKLAMKRKMCKSGAEGNKNFFYFSIFNEGVLCANVYTYIKEGKQALRHDMKGAMMIQHKKYIA